MTDQYQSGVRPRGLWSGRLITLALGGHSYHQIVPEQEPTGDLFGPTVWNPALFACDNCHLIRASWEIKEGFYPRPCMGRVRVSALTVGFPERPKDERRGEADE